MSNNPGKTFLTSGPALKLKDFCSSIGMKINQEALIKFGSYIEILESWNEHTNITRISGAYDIVNLHFIDSISIIGCTQLHNRKTLLDIGSGGGFPGIPLKIVCPWLEVTLLDSSAKRVSFLNAVINGLQLNGIKAIQSRAEDLAHDHSYREEFDVVVARALAPLNILVELFLPFVKLHGIALAQKGPKIAEEMQGLEPAIEMLGGKISKIHNVTIHIDAAQGQELSRSIVEISKTHTSPGNYPRRMNLIKKKPLV